MVITLGERNKKLIGMKKNGYTTREAAMELGMTEAAADKVVTKYNQGGDVFSSTKEWELPEIQLDGTQHMAEHTIDSLMETMEYQRRIEMLKKSIIVGETLKLENGNFLKVKGKYPYVVYGIDAHNVPKSLTYIQLLEFGN